MFLIWRDERIIASFSGGSSIIMLPPTTAEEKQKIWNPLTRIEIRNLKERRYVLNPIIWKMGLMASKTANYFWNRKSKMALFPDLTAVVWSQIEWRVTISCPFNFSTFPFDENECSFPMMLPFNWNLTISNENRHATSYNADGFEIECHSFGPYSGYLKVLGFPWTKFGLNVHVKRHISKYIFEYYLPTITIVMASSVSFIIPLTAIPGRVALVVTQFLTLTNIFIHHMVITLNFFRPFLRKL